MKRVFVYIFSLMFLFGSIANAGSSYSSSWSSKSSFSKSSSFSSSKSSYSSYSKSSSWTKSPSDSTSRRSIISNYNSDNKNIVPTKSYIINNSNNRNTSIKNYVSNNSVNSANSPPIINDSKNRNSAITAYNKSNSKDPSLKYNTTVASDKQITKRKYYSNDSQKQPADSGSFWKGVVVAHVIDSMLTDKPQTTTQILSQDPELEKARNVQITKDRINSRIAINNFMSDNKSTTQKQLILYHNLYKI